MPEFLFIGGPRDGERLNFEEPLSHHVTMPANPQRRGHEAALFAGYRLGQLVANDSLEGFYYFDEMTYVDALIALVRGYRPLKCHHCRIDVESAVCVACGKTRREIAIEDHRPLTLNLPPYPGQPAYDILDELVEMTAQHWDRLAALAADTPAVVTPPSDASAGRP